MTTEKKSFDVEIKSISTDKGEVKAIVSVFGNVDSYNDRMMAGSFSKTLSEWKASGNPIPFIWSHDWENPDSYVGEVLEANETPEGLEVLAKVDLDRPKANQVFHLLKTKRVTQFSFGYIARDWDFVTEEEYGQVRQVKDVQLLEVGPTLLGANQATRLIEAASALVGRKAAASDVDLGVFVSWDYNEGVLFGRIEHIMTDGVLGLADSEYALQGTPENPALLIRIYRQTEEEWEEGATLMGANASDVIVVDPLVEDSSAKAVDFKFDTPAWMQENAQRGLDWWDEGFAGDGVTAKTVAEAREIRDGKITEDKAVRMAAWFARHMSDLDAPSADPDNEDFPSPGVVAHALWGGGTRQQSERAMAWAEDRVAELEQEENESSSDSILEQKNSTIEKEMVDVVGDTSPTIDQERLLRLLLTTRYSER